MNCQKADGSVQNSQIGIKQELDTDIRWNGRDRRVALVKKRPNYWLDSNVVAMKRATFFQLQDRNVK